jgi:hypothetical protein
MQAAIRLTIPVVQPPVRCYYPEINLIPILNLPSAFELGGLAGFQGLFIAGVLNHHFAPPWPFLQTS